MNVRDATGEPNSIQAANDYGFEVYGPDGRWCGWGCDEPHAQSLLRDLRSRQRVLTNLPPASGTTTSGDYPANEENP